MEVKILSDEDPPPRLPIKVEECLFRVVQEALNNVVKHAQTDRATVTLDYRSDPARVLIEDQGAGFDARIKGVPGHYGLAGMEERVRSIGARLVIESQPGSGTCVRVEDLRKEELEHA